MRLYQKGPLFLSSVISSRLIILDRDNKETLAAKEEETHDADAFEHRCGPVLEIR